ncbi:c-type cytochrome [Nitrosophilus alvini]|uniref:c-type cytochrome n=1 Tax=Nitrosophilus alvini TaxID=2714855 RepID=UPI00190C69F7|nr:c-type cytochrome [Nitrosophilus alvini]
MKKIFISLLLGILGIVISGCNEKEKQIKTNVIENSVKIENKKIDKEKLKKELANIDTVEYLENYIIDVINNGSNRLDYKAGSMDAGFASKEDAPKIAAYVVTLSGKKPSVPEYIKEGNMLYNGNCGGCHGDDGKGLGGSFPDLTKKRFSGIEKRKKELMLLLSNR